MENIAYFTLSNLKPVQPIQGWQEFLEDGSGFLATAMSAYKNGKKAYTAGILYNLVAMAIEKFVMAALMKRGTMPYNHTMKDFVEAMEETYPDAITDIRTELLQLDTYQDICDLEGFSIAPPEMEEIPAMIVLAGKMQSLAIRKITVD